MKNNLKINCFFFVAVILESILMKTKFGLWKILCFILLLTGVIFVAKPTWLFGQAEKIGQNYYFGIFLALAAGFCASITYVSVGLVDKEKVAPSVLILYPGMLQLMSCFLLTFIDKNDLILSGKIGEITMEKWLFMGLITFLGIFATYVRTKANQMLSPSLVNFIRSLEITFALFAQVLFFNDLPTILSIIGSVLVVLSVFAKILEEKITQLCPECLQNFL